MHFTQILLAEFVEFTLQTFLFRSVHPGSGKLGGFATQVIHVFVVGLHNGVAQAVVLVVVHCTHLLLEEFNKSTRHTGEAVGQPRLAPLLSI